MHPYTREKRSPMRGHICYMSIHVHVHVLGQALGWTVGDKKGWIVGHADVVVNHEREGRTQPNPSGLVTQEHTDNNNRNSNTQLRACYVRIQVTKTRIHHAHSDAHTHTAKQDGRQCRRKKLMPLK